MIPWFFSSIYNFLFRKPASRKPAGSDSVEYYVEQERADSVDKYIKYRLMGQTDWYDRRARQNKLHYLFLSAVAVITSALIPIGVALGGPEQLSAILGGVASVAAASLALLKSQENWLHYRSTAEQLKKERFFYERGSGPYAPHVLRPAPNNNPRARKADEELVERVEELISEEHGAWRERREGRGAGEQEQVPAS